MLEITAMKVMMDRFEKDVSQKKKVRPRST